MVYTCSTMWAYSQPIDMFVIQIRMKSFSGILESFRILPISSSTVRVVIIMPLIQLILISSFFVLLKSMPRMTQLFMTKQQIDSGLTILGSTTELIFRHSYMSLSTKTLYLSKLSIKFLHSLQSVVFLSQHFFKSLNLSFAFFIIFLKWADSFEKTLNLSRSSNP